MQQHFPHRLRMEIAEHGFQRETVFFAERDDQTVVGGCSLEFEIKGDTEALAQGQSPGLVDAPTEGGVNDKLHSAAFVEKPFSHDGGLRGDRSENGAAAQHVLDSLLGATRVQAAFLCKPVKGRPLCIDCPLCDLPAYVG